MFKTSLFVLCLTAAASAHAGLSVERQTTIRDDFGGNARIDSNAVIGEEAGTRIASATFTHFHPRTENAFVDGEIDREAVRDGELTTVSYDGELVISSNGQGNNGNGQAQQLSIQFVDLTVTRAEEGMDLSGSLVVNGQTVDAAEAPARVRAVLLGLLRFFKL